MLKNIIAIISALLIALSVPIEPIIEPIEPIEPKPIIEPMDPGLVIFKDSLDAGLEAIKPISAKQVRDEAVLVFREATFQTAKYLDKQLINIQDENISDARKILQDFIKK
jgi:hypothetical protein